jgi:glycosyltransferase involved in cell wall biosynthesis
MPLDPDGQLRVTIVGSGSPARGGIPSCLDLITKPGFFPENIDVNFINTTRVATRTAGRLSVTNIRSAVTDMRATWRAARSSDVVHLHVAPGRPFPAARAVALCAASRIAGAGVICHIHSARLNGGRSEEVHSGRIYRWLLRRLSMAHAIATVSDAGTRVVSSLIPAVPVMTVDNAVDVNSFTQGQPDRERPVVTFVGTISKRKGLIELLAATNILHGRGVTHWELRIIGGANEVGEAEADQIRADYRSAGFGDVFVGSLDSGQVRSQLAEASIFVLPSHAEGQPIAILEAMAAGVPVVATTVGAIPDVVIDAECGLLIEPGQPGELADALDRLITDKSERVRLGEAARRRALERHDLDTLARRLLQLYRAHARNTKRTRPGIRCVPSQ